MSWELVSFLILGAVLLGGFAWYERSRPPAQVVALVAALAALAIAGRIAFAAFPNVKPTTDIVIFAGYALGPAPGFAVGALAALVSNFWFGQGPWTPWQMAGWGLCGVLGAALALGGRNAGRLSLAATCGLAGIAYGALLNFSLMATYGGELSLERFGVLSARAIPFDAAHAVGNVVLALVAGPAIVRMLSRFRQRFEWERGGGEGKPPAPPEPPDREPPRRLHPALKGGGIAALIVVSLLLAVLAPSRAEAAGADRALQWLLSVQNGDGGFGASPDDDSGTEMTAWAMLGFEAAGRNPYDLTRGNHTPISYLRGHVDELASPGDLARTTLALLGAGADPRDFGGRNLVASLRDKRLDNGSYKNWPNSTAFAVIALRAAGAPGGVDKSLDWLRTVQNDDGGWGNEPGQRSDAEATGSVLQALSSDSKAAQRGLDFLRDSQQGNGGYRVGGNGAINTQATAWAIQGILAAGGKLDSFTQGGLSALDYIASNQAGDGHYRYSKSSDQTPIWVTGQALVAVSRDFFPIAVPARKEKAPQTKASNTGGAAPPLSNPTISPSPETEPIPSSPGTSAGGGVGSLPEGLPTPGQQQPGPSSGASPPAGGGSGAPEAAAPESSGSGAVNTEDSVLAQSDEDDESPVFGAILLGLLAGCLLFGLGLLGRKGWMRWRYGL
jgi:energy-coupling factor transport system substrate-specific component